MIPHVFGIGHPRSGGHSLSLALNLIGIKSLHFGLDKTGGGTHAKAMYARYASNQDPIVDYGDYAALVDWPLWHVWESIKYYHADSMFILTTRNPYNAALSWMRLMHRVPVEDVLRDGLQTSIAEVAESYLRHQDRVMHSFLYSPSKLLVIDTEDAQDTKLSRLCNFLGVDPPENVIYPTSEDTSVINKT